MSKEAPGVSTLRKPLVRFTPPPDDIRATVDGVERMRITSHGTYVRVGEEMVRVEDRMIHNEVNGTLREAGCYLEALKFPASEVALKKFLRAHTRGVPTPDEGIRMEGTFNCPECDGDVFYRQDIFSPSICARCSYAIPAQVTKGGKVQWEDERDWA